jgi:hypothetical protein
VFHDGLDNVELTGRWIGFYRYRWEALGTYPIVAELIQSGGTITGEMYDQITEHSEYFNEFVDVIERDIPDEARRRMRQMIQRFGPRTVRNARLPDASDVEGKLRGSQLSFKKTYRGAMELSWSVDGATVASLRRDRHQVHYSGKLDLERMCIAGRWIIWQRGLLGWLLPPDAWGSFELYKKS